MLSISARGSAASAEAYYEHLAEQDDYYLKGQEPPGQWQGKGAEALGLSGEVTREDFAAALRGFKPGSEEKLVHNAGEKHMAGWDLTFSAPKSVSVLWALAPEDVQAQLAAAHDAAVTDALKFVEEHATFTRRGEKGVQEKANGLLVSTFQHGTSREQDPQLHTHSFVHNVAERQDGSWGSLDSRHFYRWKMASGAYYRAALAERLQDLGFEVRRDGKSFAVAGVSEKVEKHFSKRRAQIEEVLERMGASGAKASATVSLKTRKAKTAQDREALHEQWQQEAAELGFEWQDKDRSTPAERLPMAERDAMLDQLTEQNSTFDERRLWEKVATEAQGAIGIHEIADVVGGLRNDKEVVHLQRREVEVEQRTEVPEPQFSTRKMLTLEQDMIETAQRMSENKSHAVTDAQLGETLAARPTLTAEQIEALRYLTRDSGSIALVRGMAGTGKSYLLDAARETWEKAGYNVQGVALQGKTAQDLQDGTGIQSQTMHSFLNEIQGRGNQPPTRELSDKDIIIIEEAGMIGSRQMRDLEHLANNAGAKLAIVGDQQQLQPLDAGGAFKALQTHVGAVELTGIRRQREAWMRQAVRDLATGQAATALAGLDKAGRLHIAEDNIGARAQLVEQWVASEQPLSQRLMLARTNEDVSDLNLLARHCLKGEGKLTDGVDLVNGNEAREIATGERIRFTRNDYKLDVRNGTTATVTGIEQHEGQVVIYTETDGGQAVQFPASGPDAFTDFDYAYATTVHKSQGMTVEDTHLLVTPGVDREWSYVGLSRARGEAHVYLSEETIQDMMQAIPPTEKMLDFATSVASQKGIELPEEAADNFQVCRDFLNENLPKYQLNSDFNELAEAAREAARQMAVSHAKDTTLDYDEILEELADDVRAAMGEGETLREVVNDVTEQAVVRHEVAAEASQAAEPPDMPLPPVEAYQELEWEFEPD
ncbi:relaxase domain-containing protein [Acidithiobacillus thiooxidans]|uniref:MobF family relaxase n=1 Tax=Acidithiobacillus thiooxidans TaxID=930 RepID=UPI001C069B19|nr:MobF family relaxase [Acidithiobacillus thiooxidans]MBU2834412.1 relaxase domain-containing protein [Acidithiobacillus thiooxidans]